MLPFFPLIVFITAALLNMPFMIGIFIETRLVDLTAITVQQV